jgi:hypothetical protein
VFREELAWRTRWYMFLGKDPRKHIGHNPVAHVAMFFFIALGLPFAILSGLALDSKGAGRGAWMGWAFGWFIPFVGSSLVVHWLHRPDMWALAIFTIRHVHAAIRKDIMSPNSFSRPRFRSAGPSGTIVPNRRCFCKTKRAALVALGLFRIFRYFVMRPAAAISMQGID